METVQFELDGTNKGWRCSGCGLLVDSIGRPLFGNETWIIKTKSINWVENEPQFKFCPSCGKRVKQNA